MESGLFYEWALGCRQLGSASAASTLRGGCQPPQRHPTLPAYFPLGLRGLEIVIEYAAAEQARAQVEQAAERAAAERRQAREAKELRRLAADRGYVAALDSSREVDARAACVVCMENAAEDANPPDCRMPCCVAHVHRAVGEAQNDPSTQDRWWCQACAHGGCRYVPGMQGTIEQRKDRAEAEALRAIIWRC